MVVVQECAEDRVFGKAPFVAYPLINRDVYDRFTKLRHNVSVKIVVLGFLIALSSFIIFLLGVNIVIQYRTINIGLKINMFKKLCYISLSLLAILQLIFIIAWVIEKWEVQTTKRTGYQRLQPDAVIN